MSRSWGRHLLTAVFVGIAACALTPACAKNDESIYIAAVLAPAATRTNGACQWTNDPTQTRLFNSLFDVGVRDDYEAVLLIANQMIPRQDPAAPRVESNAIHIDGAVIRVTDPNGNDVVPSFTSFTSGAVALTQNNGNPGYLSVGVPIIDGNTAANLRTQVPQDRVTQKEFLVQIRVFGKTLGGVDVESGEYQQPLKVCNGCLVSFAGADDPNPMLPQPNCLKPLDSTATTSLPCFNGQDEVALCQLCQGKPACKPP